MTTAATDAGADSAVQPTAASSSGAGAIFEILMTAAGQPTTDPAANPEAALLPVDGSPALPEAATLDPATQALASDMEQMVQALAITAEVVAQGMAARTTPVHEIILTVETPTSEKSEQATLPSLSILVPNPTEPGPSLKVSDADPAKNLDPALIALLPPLPKTTTPEPQVQEASTVESELINTQIEPTEPAAPTFEMPVLQPSSAPVEEAYGPWRAEIHGPVLNAQRELVTQPVHVPVFEVPEAIAILSPLPDANTPPDMASTLANGTMVSTPDAMGDMSGLLPTNLPIPVVTIHVSVKAKAPTDGDESGADQTLASATASEPSDRTPIDTMLSAPIIVAPSDFIGPQMIPLVTADRQSVTPTLTDDENLSDALNAPRPAQADAHVLRTVQVRAEAVTVTTSKPSAPPVLTQSAAATPGKQTEVPAFDVAAVVEALHRDADLARVAHRQADETREYASLLETKIANPVAKTSSRSSSDIRDLMKLGVRDIEIVQSTGSAQTMNVGPQLQTNELTGASAATRAQVADAFAPTGNEANTAERRAQAHEIRMRAIERQVVAAVRDGSDTIRMQLYPPGLGQIIIRLTMDGSKLKLSTSANSSDAADSLRSIEGDLRDALSVGGLELTGFDVSEDGEGGNKGRKNTSESENNNQQSRSAKSDDFALDMNA